VKRVFIIFIALLVLYVSGVFVRGQKGIAVILRNRTSYPLRNVEIKVDHKGRRYALADLAAGKTVRVYVQPVGASSINLEFTDPQNLDHQEMLAGYVETGYCGRTTATIFPDHVAIDDHSFGVICWMSWLDFVL
jgi:hypothetical protein